MYKYLNSISSPSNIKEYNLGELKELASEIREAILNRLSIKGGHFGPNLGIVECTIALHYVFNSPIDKIVFDVSHQCYAHKILTGRAKSFICDSELDKICGFTSTEESEHDIFNVGHTSTSISLACGLAKAKELKGSSENIIAIIGDGSLSGGQAFEGLSSAAEINAGMIIVVNDNDMSIAENHGGLYQGLKALRDSNGKCENNFFKSLGLGYKYVNDGNDIEALIKAFNELKDTATPVVLHINTVKGKGYESAEIEKEKYHFFGPFDRKTGEGVYKNSSESYISISRDFLVDKIQSDKLFAVVCAGTPSCIGFDEQTRTLAKNQYIDVGIAEPNAVGYASAMAKGGIKPIFATYSSFIQRCYDQMSQDLCLNKTCATVLVSNASIYGMRDQTHIGLFDIPLLSSIPNLIYLAPSSKQELISMLEWSYKQSSFPVAIKMPSGPVFNADYEVKSDFADFKYQITKSGQGIAILALGAFYKIGVDLYNALKERGINATLINPSFANGLDKDTLDELCKSHSTFVTIEDGVLDGGFGQRVASYLGKSDVKVFNYGFERCFFDRYNVSEILRAHSLTPEQIINDII